MPRRLPLVALVALVAAVASLSACLENACTTDAQCETGAICQAGECATLCSTDDGCTTPRVCEDGVCGYADRCRVDDDCAVGEVCEGQLCRSQTPECDLNSDCPPNFRCCEGGCYPAESTQDVCRAECRDDVACDADQTCDDGRCRDRELDAADTADAGSSDDGGTDTASADAGTDDPPDEGVDSPTTDAEPDSGDRDTADPDTADPDADDPDTTCTFDSDCGDDRVCVDGECRPEPTDTGDPCDGRDDGQLGERCTGPDACCNGLCFGNPDAGRGVCTIACDSWRECNPVGAGGDELFCYRHPELPDPLCALSDYGDSCVGADDCVAQRCLLSTMRRACTYPCSTTADCASGAACGLVNFAVGGGAERPEFVCTPIGATPCRVSADCLSGTCLTDDETGVSYCSTICNVADLGACPAGFVCEELPVSPTESLPVCVLSGA